MLTLNFELKLRYMCSELYGLLYQMYFSAIVTFKDTLIRKPVSRSSNSKMFYGRRHYVLEHYHYVIDFASMQKGM